VSELGVGRVQLTRGWRQLARRQTIPTAALQSKQQLSCDPLQNRFSRMFTNPILVFQLVIDWIDLQS
jgi:hypothetical protein